MRLTLVRHAEPDWAPRGVLDIDPALTELGHEQASRVAKRLAAGEPVDRLLVSSATRAQQTAEPIAETLGIASEVNDWLHEVRIHDKFDGMPFDEYLEQIQPIATRPFPMWENGANGTAELTQDFVPRVMAGVEALFDEVGVLRAEGPWGSDWTLPADETHVLMIAHGGTIATLITQLLGYETTAWEWERPAASQSIGASGAGAPVRTVSSETADSRARRRPSV